MDKKNHQPKNVSHQSNILWDEKLRKEGAKWVQKDNFWLFGILFNNVCDVIGAVRYLMRDIIKSRKFNGNLVCF